MSSPNVEEDDSKLRPIQNSVEQTSPTPWAGGESPAPVRNPTPPKEIIGLTDSIGGTAFSKHWLFTVLMKLIKVIEQPGSEDTNPESGSSHADNEPTENGGKQSNTTPDETECSDRKVTSDADKDADESADAAESSNEKIVSADERVINISDELQDELCQLWDMSSDENVAKLLQEFKAIDILTEVISKSDAPRATEIAVGILGNMACTPSVCEAMADSPTLVNLSLCLLGNSDAPTLVECTRFLSTVLSIEKCREVWLKAWSSDSQYQENVIFILSSSVNKDLLTNTASLLDSLLDLSEEFCNSWSSVNLLTAVAEALRQLKLSVDDGTYSLFHCLQLMSTAANGVYAIVDQVELVTDILVDFLLKICEDEIVNLEETRAAGVASVISVLNIALTSSPAGYSLLYSGEKCIRCVLKIVYACDKEVVILGTPRSSPSQSNVTRGNSQLIKTLKEVLLHIITDTVNIMRKEEGEMSQLDEKEEGNSSVPPPTPAILKYMNGDCERPRLNSVINLLLQSDSREVIDNLLTLCDKYQTVRLEKIILDHADSRD